MTYAWEYPLYLIPHGGGYVSLIEPQASGEPSDNGELAGPDQHLLVVHTDEDATIRFMDRYGLAGVPWAIRNSREFRWLLQSLKEPVTQVAFDPDPEEDRVNAAWTEAISRLLSDFLVADNSPWNYPVFVVAREDGFASIEGRDPDGEATTAVGLFTREEKARGYLEASGESGELWQLNDYQEVRVFLEQLGSDVSAVALDPVVTDEGRTAKYGFAIPTLLEKYLVVE